MLKAQNNEFHLNTHIPKTKLTNVRGEKIMSARGQLILFTFLYLREGKKQGRDGHIPKIRTFFYSVFTGIV